MTTFFISHSSKDNDLAAELRTRLEAEGHRSVFLDFDPEKGLAVGVDWEQTLYRKLRASRAVLLVCTDHSMASRWCFAEIALARMEGKHIFTLKADPLSRETENGLPALLTADQMVDMRSKLESDREAAFKRLWDGFKQLGITGSPDWDRSRPPYPGMLAFDEKDAAVFFGREEKVDEGADLLTRWQRRGPGLLMVLGSSGSGKSSLVRAGLLPRLRQDPEKWLIVGPFRPGSEPHEELAASLAETFDKGFDELRKELSGDPKLARLARGLRRGSPHRQATVLLIVDQFEELLDQQSDHPAHSFLKLLRKGLEDEDSPLLVLGTMRSDFLGPFQSQPDLRDLRFESLSLGPMGPAGLRRIIEEPARIAEIELEPGLVDELLVDTETSEALPLLAFTLRELWDRYRDDHRLEVREYEDLGRLQGAVARVADEIAGPGKLSGPEETALRATFVDQLVHVTEDGRFARRTATWAELDGSVRGLVERLARARLLVLAGAGGSAARTVEVAHEALFYAWDRLARWLEEERSFLLWRQRLGRDLEDWLRTDLDDEALLRGVKLGEAEKWRSERPAGLDEGQRRFIDESIALKNRREKRTRALTATNAVSDPLLQALLLAELPDGDEPPGGVLLARQIAEKPIPLSVFRRHGSPVVSAAFAPDGRRVVTASFDHTAQVWDAVSAGDSVVLRGHTAVVRTAAFSPDGRRVVTASDDGTARIWNADGSGEPLVLEGHGGPVVGAAFDPEGRRVATASYDRTARIWNLDGSGEPRVLRGHLGAVTCARFDSTGRRIATGSRDHTARIWNVDGSDKPLTFSQQRSIFTVAFSPDGRSIVTSSSDGTAVVWPADGSGERAEVARHQDEVNWAAFSPDGRRVVTASDDHTARIWDRASHDAITVLRGHADRVLSAEFDPQGSRLVTASKDGTARTWAAIGPAEPIVLTGHDKGVWRAAFRRDGDRIVTAGADGKVRLWTLEGSEAAVVGEHEAEVYWAGFAPADSRVVSASADGTVRIWHGDEAGRAPIVLGEAGGEAARAAEFDPRGERVVAVYEDGTLRLWKADGSGEFLTVGRHDGTVWSVAFRADGAEIVTASDDGTARIWRLDGSGHLVVDRYDRSILSAAFSPGGRRVATALDDGTIRIRPVDGSEEPTVLVGHGGAVWSATFDPSGRWIATASDDRTVRIWNADGSGDPLVLRGHGGHVNSALFSPDGSRVVTASGDRSARLWRVTWRSLIAYLKRATTACLTPEERVRYLGESPEEARSGYEACERAHGRTPRPEPGTS